MALTFTPQAQARIAKILARYPNKMAACLPLLWLAQEEFGHVGPDAQALVAATLDLPASHVYGVVTFYTMYNQKPVGKYHVQVCTNVSCMLCGGYDTLGAFERKLGIRCGETTPDGLFTLAEVECLAACGGAPAVQINDRYYEPVTPETVDALVDALREGKQPPSRPKA
ncbi:MAG: NAD(P)H-dependent oxidoreductase subunit E [Deltaproteobacteria bacterium]|nr:NAD(P)H-dependent oxidoreductase subunit E [Deltaproteobacteria bacterium]